MSAFEFYMLPAFLRETDYRMIGAFLHRDFSRYPHSRASGVFRMSKEILRNSVENAQEKVLKARRSAFHVLGMQPIADIEIVVLKRSDLNRHKVVVLKIIGFGVMDENSYGGMLRLHLETGGERDAETVLDAEYIH